MNIKGIQRNMNKRLITYVYTVILFIIAVLMVSVNAYSVSSENFKLLKIDGTNQKAVITKYLEY